MASRKYKEDYEDRRPAKGGRTRSPDSPPRIKDDKKPRTGLNTGLREYFVNGERIHRDVLQRNVCYMLGNQATCRPEVYNGVSGYMVKAVRPFTDEQLDDLQELSASYVKEKARFKEEEQIKHRGRKDIPNLPFDQSETFHNYTPRSSVSRPTYQDEPQYQPNSYPNPGPQDTYRGHPAPYHHSTNAGYASGGYSPGHQMTSPPYPAPSHSISKPIMNEQPMSYNRSDRPLDRDPYLQTSHLGPPSSRDYPVDPRDPRDPRYVAPVEMGRGSRAPPSVYQQPQLNPPDVIMQDSYDPSYGQMDMDPGRQPSRVASGYPYQNSRMPVDPYDDRMAPDQGPYKMTYPREEKRRREDFDRRGNR